jgi:hypothetical protein
MLEYAIHIPCLYINIHGICQVYDLNQKICAASKDRNSPLFNVQWVVDPSNESAEVLVELWNGIW